MVVDITKTFKHKIAALASTRARSATRDGPGARSCASGRATTAKDAGMGKARLAEGFRVVSTS